MAEICSCEGGALGFGQPSCIPSFGRDRRLVFVSYLDNTGAVNSIKSTDTLDATFFEGKLNAGIGSSLLDSSLRWHITEVINNVVGERGEAITQTIDDVPFIVKQGVRSYDGTFYGSVASTPYIKSLESLSCQKVGYFIIDVKGNIIGMKNDSTGDLDPIRVEQSTMQVLYKYPNATEVQNINLKFSVEQNERDANLNYISSDSISVDIDSLNSVIQVQGTASAISTTNVTLDLGFMYGDAFNPVAFEGAVVGDFTVYNVTQSSAVTPSGVVESPAGTYVFTMSAQASSDEITVDLDKTGFIMSTITYSIP